VSKVVNSFAKCCFSILLSGFTLLDVSEVGEAIDDGDDAVPCQLAHVEVHFRLRAVRLLRIRQQPNVKPVGNVVILKKIVGGRQKMAKLLKIILRKNNKKNRHFFRKVVKNRPNSDYII
jgi:hypothetical protein